MRKIHLHELRVVWISIYFGPVHWSNLILNALISILTTPQVKYLGGITFLLKDACPEDSPASARTTYQQCAATEALHVSPSVRGERRVTVWLDPVCHWQTQDWRQAHRARLHGPLLRRLLGGERRQDPRLSLQWEEVHTVRQFLRNFLNLQMRIWRFRLQNHMRWQCSGTPSPPSNFDLRLLCLMNF